jgi:hypothetical protein
MQCEQCREQFGQLHDGALSPEQAAAMRRHMADCADCAAGYAQFAVAVDSVRSLEPVSPPPRLLAQISSALDEIPAPSSPAQRAVRLGPWLAAAACFAVIFVGIMKHTNYSLPPTLEPQAQSPHPPRSMSSEAMPAPAMDDAEVDAETEAGKASAVVAESAPDAREAEEISATTARSPDEGEPTGRATRRVVAPPVRAEGSHPPVPASERHDETDPAVPPPPRLERAVQPEVAAEQTAKAARSAGGVRPEITAAGSGPTRLLTDDKASQHAERTEATVKYFDTTPTKAATEMGAVPTPAKGQPSKLFVRFIPPRVRRVGLPVTAAVTLNAAAAFPDVAVRVETLAGLRLATAQDSCIYRGPLAADDTEKIEFKLLADRQGTHRLRVSVETPVAGLQAQMEVILPDFEVGDDSAAATDALGHSVTVTFKETPLRQAFLELARQGRISLVLASTVGNERVTYSCIETPAGSVVRILAETHGYEITVEDNSYYISKKQ